MPANITLIGNLTRDPELKVSQGGVSYLPFSLAVNNNKKNANGEWETEASYFDCTAFKELAENIAGSVTKGTRLVVTGRVEQENWEDKETGAKRSKLVVIVDEVAASLKYASAVVTKNERTTDGGNSGYNSGSNTTRTSFGSNRADNQRFEDEPF